MHQTEILAPAGSFETMKAAYKAGADAVYIGGMLFGARAYADNADMNEMLQAIDYAHLHGRRLYLTVNTLLKNTEIEQKLMDYLKPYYEQGLDAVIVQDPGVLQWIRYHFPELAIHASTQMTVCGSSYGRELAERGVTRIVTPRELSLQEIADMKRETGLEIETFVHGALCYCYSGQCLMSSMIGGRSGNRGRCAQPCRLPYTFYNDKGKNSGYLLSPKDLCSLDLLPDILEAGVDSLKIEGRMKKPEYAALTTAVYRKYVDLYQEKGRKAYAVQPEDREALMDLYNRGGFTDGYFHQHNGRGMMSVKRPNHSGVFVGMASQVKNEWQLQAEKPLHPGDILEMPDGTSVKVEQKAAAGSRIRLRYRGKATKGKVPVIRTRNEALIETVTSLFVKDYELKEKIYGSVTILKDFPAKMNVSYASCGIETEGDMVQEAQNHPLTAADVYKRLTKTGGTPFTFENLEVRIGEGCYLNVQSLNQLRRQALEELETMVLAPYRRHMPVQACENMQKSAGHKNSGKPFISVLAENEEQLSAALQFPEVNRIYVNDEGDDARLLRMADMTHAKGREFYLALPYILRSDAGESYKKRSQILSPSVADGFLVRNMETWLMLQELNAAQPCTGDYHLYCMNDIANDIYLQKLDGTTLPVELNRRELMALGHTADSELLVYGYLPLMVSAQCLMKTTGNCTGVSGIHYLEDRFHKKLPVKNICRFCYNLIYNNVPIHLYQAVLQDIHAIGPRSVRLQFLNESADETKKLIQCYIQALNGTGSDGQILQNFTKGHYQRGIE